MKIFIQTTVCVVIITVLSSCMFAYKRGASNQNLVNDEKVCYKQAGNDKESEAFHACMHARGWSIVNTMKSDQLAVDHRYSHKSASKDLATPVTDSFPEESTWPQPATHTSDSQETSSIVVSSWWKFGAGPERLKQDQENCHSRTGRQDKSGMTIQWNATADFRRCMKDLGWSNM